VKPDDLHALATYNSEVMRGLVHTPEWRERMAQLQDQFNIETYGMTTAEMHGQLLVRDAPRLRRWRWWP